MKHCELNKLIAVNLKRLRNAAKLTQEQLAEELAVSSRLIQKWEAGTKGIGKEVLKKICRFFNVKPYVFFVDETAPYVTSPREKKVLYTVRAAERLGVADFIEHCGDYIVRQAEEKARLSKPDRTQKVKKKNGNGRKP